MTSKPKKKFFYKHKKHKNNSLSRPREVYMPTAQDLEIAAKSPFGNARFEELVSLPSLELAKALLSNPEISFANRYKVLVNISKMQEPEVSIYEKCHILNQQINSKNFSTTESISIKNLFASMKEQQSETATRKIRKSISKVKSNLDDLQMQNMRKSEGQIAILKASQIWERDIQELGNPELFWEVLTYLHFAQLDNKDSKLFEEGNRNLINSLSRIIHFLPMEELNSRFNINQSSNPIFYAGILMARINYRSNQKTLMQFIDFMFTMEESMTANLGEATRTNQLKAKERKNRAQAVADKAKAERDELERRIIECRAAGAFYAQREFDLFLKDLKKVDGREWNLDSLSDFLMKDYRDSNIQSGVLNFLIKNFEFLDHPIPIFLSNGATVTFETTDGQFLLYRIRVAYFGNYDLLFKKYDTLKDLLRAETGGFQYGEVSLANMSYTTVSGIRRLLYEHFSNLNVTVATARFSRGKSNINLLDLIAYVYSEVNIGELIPLYFTNWEFFTDGYPCEGCGRPLTHQVSAVKGKGPVCGDHNYSLGKSDASRVEKVISRVRKERLFANYSPLIRQRVETFVWNPTSGKALLNMIANLPNLSHLQAMSEIERRIRGRIKPPRIAWGSSRRRRRY